MITLKDKIKELTKIVQEIGKLTDEITVIVGKLTLLALAVIGLLQIIKGG